MRSEEFFQQARHREKYLVFTVGVRKRLDQASRIEHSYVGAINVRVLT